MIVNDLSIDPMRSRSESLQRRLCLYTIMRLGTRCKRTRHTQHVKPACNLISSRLLYHFTTIGDSIGTHLAAHRHSALRFPAQLPRFLDRASTVDPSSGEPERRAGHSAGARDIRTTHDTLERERERVPRDTSKNEQSDRLAPPRTALPSLSRTETDFCNSVRAGTV